MQEKSAEGPADGVGAGSADATRAPAWAATRSWRSWLPPRVLSTLLIMAVGPVVALAAGTYLYMSGGRYVATDNAYVKADKIAVSADVAGRVTEVLVRADEAVKQGQPLFRLDREPYKLLLEKAAAELDQTVARVEALRAEYREAQGEMKEAEDRIQFFDAQRARQKRLADKGVGRAFVFEEADSNADASRARANVARQKMHRVLAQLSGKPDIEASAHPLVREKAAVRDHARLDLEHTEIKAPAAGIVTNFDLQPGEYVRIGSTVFSLVGTDEIWVQANFKETDLTFVDEGQTASVHVDTYPDGAWQAVVTSISPATGAEFAVLPPQNATGNWVKVVQRLPVRLRLLARPGARPLRAGMSVVVEIDTGHRRPLPGWASALLGRAKASQ